MNMKKGQAAMEFLMTYGWAILVVLAAIGALAYFGVLSPGNLLPERTVFKAPLPNVDNSVSVLGSDDTVASTIAFRNNRGGGITLPLTGDVGTGDCTSINGGVTGTYNGAAIVADTTVIPNGEAFLLTINCSVTGKSVGDKFKGSISFDYTNTDTSQTRPHSGSVDAELLAP